MPLSLLPLALLGRLPLRYRRRLGGWLGDLARQFSSRKKIAQRNLMLAFPELSSQTHEDILRQHFRLLGATLLDECALLTMSQERLRQFITITYENEIGDFSSSILVAPHFVGVSVGGTRVSMISAPLLFHYKPLHNRFWNTFYQHLRERWQAVGAAATQARAMRLCASHLQNSGCLFYLPDIDPKARKSTVFTPFLGVAQKATTTAIGRLAAMTGARVVLCVATMTASGYNVRLESLTNFPSNAAASAAYINKLIEIHVRAQPEQYYWLHRYFKTRPAGENSLYD